MKEGSADSNNTSRLPGALKETAAKLLAEFLKWILKQRSTVRSPVGD